MDGRTERGLRNRRAIVDAALAFVAQHDALPTTQQIAEAAGVAPRSVFHHFAGLDVLLAEAASTQAERWQSLLSPPEPGLTLDERLATALAQRTALFEQIGAIRRVAVRLESSSPVLAELLDASRDALRRHLRRHLNPELADLDAASKAGVEAAASWEMWQVLRKDLSIADAQDALAALLTASLDRTFTGSAPPTTSKEH